MRALRHYHPPATAACAGRSIRAREDRRAMNSAFRHTNAAAATALALVALIGTALWAQDAPTTKPAAAAGTQPATGPVEKVVTESGLTILKVAPGENDISARVGDQVFVHYVG